MENPTITIDLRNDSIRDLELVRKLIDDELTKRRSRRPLSERIVLATKPPNSTRQRIGALPKKAATATHKSPIRRASPKRSPPKKASPRRASPARTLKGLLSPIKSEDQRAAETVLVTDLPEITEQALLDELATYGDVIGLEFVRNESDEVLNQVRVRFASGDSVNRIVGTNFGRSPVLRGARVYRVRKGLTTARELDKDLEGAPVLPSVPSTTKKSSTRRRRGTRGRGRGAKQ